jgi:hypothetical protein
MIGFLVFEFEIIFILFMLIDFGLVIFLGIVFIMRWEILSSSFGY